MADRRQHTTPQQGGFWSSPQANYSKETQNLLKDMMKESKLTNFQQRKLQEKMKSGEPLPPKCGPTFTEKPKQQIFVAPPSKVIDPRTYSGGVRSKETIEASGAYKKTDYKPPPKPGRSEREKERLGFFMAYGKDLPPPTRKKKAAPEKSEAIEKEKDRFDELQDEINERRQFLDHMENLGQANNHRTVIETEISQLIREMELIDKRRTEELEKLMQQQDNQK